MSFSPVGQVLEAIQSQESWTGQRLFTQLLHHWPQVVGVPVAGHAHPIGMYHQVLQVSVSSAVWAQQLSFERRSILAKLHILLNNTTILDIHFSTARWQKVKQLNRSVSTAKLFPKTTTNTQNTLNHLSPPTSAQDAFQRWAQIAQTSQQKARRCPQCGSPCPSPAIDRWHMCGNCATRYLFSI